LDAEGKAQIPGGANVAAIAKNKNGSELKRIILHLCKWSGIFHLSLALTKSKLRILCYHGFAADDEAEFRPRLFITQVTFERRMKFLTARGFRVLGLAEALKMMDANELPPKAVVLTIDDGFAGVFDRGLPVLIRNGFTSTIYVTTYNQLKATPVFRLVVQYLFWKTRASHIDLPSIHPDLEGRLLLASERDRERAINAVTEHGEAKLDEPARQKILERLAEQLAVDLATILERRLFSIMTAAELKKAIANGMTVELHTHRHRLPMDSGLVATEIGDNRAVLEPLVGHTLKHFCYPSGLFDETQWPWLTTLGVESATTCVPGLNDAHTPKLGLRRCLDGENLSQIEFEAEMYGTATLLRSGRELVRRIAQGQSQLSGRKKSAAH